MRREVLRLGKRGLEVGRRGLEVGKERFGGWLREVWRLGRERFGGWRIKFKNPKGLFSVRQALGQSSFVGVRQSRWRYVVLMAQDSTTLFHWSWAGVRRPRALCPPHGPGKLVPTGGPKCLHPRREEELRGD